MWISPLGPLFGRSLPPVLGAQFPPSGGRRPLGDGVVLSTGTQTWRPRGRSPEPALDAKGAEPDSTSAPVPPDRRDGGVDAFLLPMIVTRVLTSAIRDLVPTLATSPQVAVRWPLVAL